MKTNTPTSVQKRSRAHRRHPDDSSDSLASPKSVDNSSSPALPNSTRTDQIEMPDNREYVLEELNKSGKESDRPETLIGLLKDDTDSKEHHSSPNLKGDYGSIAVLVFLYILQGIPLGLSGAIPMILQNRGVSYSEQAMFSLGNWPFSVKLLWAPLVDAMFVARFGRRKSWLVPVQYLIGITLLLVSPRIDDMMGGSEQVEFNQTHGINSTDSNDSTVRIHHPAIYTLTGLFLLINFLCATQDIAVDGWALTMLSRRNVIYASTCNTVGQTAGFFLGNVVLLAFESPDFCNRYLRTVPQSEGLFTLSGFLYFWGIVFIVTTTLIALFKADREHSAEERELQVLQTYKSLYRILNLPAVRKFVFLLLTCKIGFAITDAASGLKLIEAGIHKENMALMAVPMVPVQIILPWIISRYTKGPNALNVFLGAYPYR